MITRNKHLAAAAIAALVLSVAVAPASAGGVPRNQIKMFMLNTGVDPAYHGLVLLISNKAQSFFMIKLTNMDPNSPYDVELDGTAEETITTNSSGQGMVLHRSRTQGNPAPLPLPYDPRGHTLSIAEQGTVVLTTEFPATPTVQRLARALLDFGQQARANSFPLPVTHEELAFRLGTVREVVSRNLSRFQAEGLLRIQRREIQLLDRAGLQREAETEL